MSFSLRTELSTKSRISGIRWVKRIYLRIWSLLSPTCSAKISLDFFPLNLCASGSQVKSVRCPCRFIASNFILYAKAFSDGKICSLCRLESTMTMVASSSVINCSTISVGSQVAPSRTAISLAVRSLGCTSSSASTLTV